MTIQPGHLPPPTATQAGQPLLNPADQSQIDRIADAFNQAIDQATSAPTAYKDPTPVPAIGTAPPVPQPGRPPMSQRAVDINTTMLSAGVTSVLVSGGVSLVLWASGHADPTVVGLIVAIPPVCAIPIVAIASVLKRAKQVVQSAPAEHHHHHYNGAHVHQDHRSTHTETRGVWAKTNNRLPR
ncbi:hypothetical protein ACWD4O_39130 [Streptomyces sp. NPDC002623]